MRLCPQTNPQSRLLTVPARPGRSAQQLTAAVPPGLMTLEVIAIAARTDVDRLLAAAAKLLTGWASLLGRSVTVTVAWAGGILVRARRLLGGGDAARQSMIALVLNSSTSFIAGAVLGSITGTLEALPGLLVMVPAAIGLRGNIFSAFGNRVSTAIHTGTFEMSAKREGVLGQNAAASACLTLAMSVALAVLAKAVAVFLGIPGTVSVVTLCMISVLGGVLASLPVLVAAVLLAAGAVRYGWDLDNVNAPLVSTLGDVLTIPALWFASLLVPIPLVSTVTGVALIVVSGVALAAGWRSRLSILRRAVRESTPILVAAAALSTLAGVTIEHRLDTFARLPALLVLEPAFVSSAGALGGILSARLGSKFHLGLVAAGPIPEPDAVRDAALVMVLGAPVFLFNAVGAHLVALLLGQSSPGLGAMVAASMVGGFLAVAFALLVAYYATTVSVAVGVDPDTFGIPIVTSAVDFVGAVALIVTLVGLSIV
ncbi:MAG: magnesium transporter [Egibacteraceae bacterium]